MSIADILIILACLAGGYWIVSSVMGPGVDITRREPPPEGGKQPHNPRQADWHLLLDVPRTASRAEIEAAFRRQQEKARAAFDTRKLEQLQQAREAGLGAADQSR